VLRTSYYLKPLPVGSRMLNEFAAVVLKWAGSGSCKICSAALHSRCVARGSYSDAPIVLNACGAGLQLTTKHEVQRFGDPDLWLY
jgi:hypothetical protein